MKEINVEEAYHLVDMLTNRMSGIIGNVGIFKEMTLEQKMAAIDFDRNIIDKLNLIIEQGE